MTNSENIELAFKHYFPKLTIVRNVDNQLLRVKFDDSELISLNLYSSESGIYTSELWTNDDFIYLHQSTDLNELMQVTKQKLNDMFADWTSKVN